MVAGTPEEVAKNRISRTAPFLREVLAQGREVVREQKSLFIPSRRYYGEGPRNCK